MPDRPHGQCTFSEITQQSNQEASLSQKAGNIAGADTTAFQFTNIPSRPRTHEVIARSEASQSICAENASQRLKRPDRLHLFRPSHDFKASRTTTLGISLRGQRPA